MRKSLIVGLSLATAILGIVNPVRAEGSAEATINFSGYLTPSVTLVSSEETTLTSPSLDESTSSSDSLTITSNTQQEKIIVNTTGEYRTLTVD